MVMRTKQPTKCLYHISYGGWGWARKTNLSPPVIHYWPFQGGGSDVVSVSCFGVRVRWCFTLCLFIILLVQFGLLSGHLLGKSCPLGQQFVLIVFCLFVIFIYFPFWFKERNLPFDLLQFLFIAFLLLQYRLQFLQWVKAFRFAR